MKWRPDISNLTRERARNLRSRSTNPERMLWHYLRNRRLAGLKFYRQQPIGPFIADYVCREQRLIIELDGESHRDRGVYDRERERFLRDQNYVVLRLANDDILHDIESVLFAVVNAAGLNAEDWKSGKLGKLPAG
jgi:very-short-patch-repair endonuclease